MGAADLLRHLRGAGLVLAVTPAGGLHVAPRDALVLMLQGEASRAPPPRRSGNPLMTPEQGDACHADGWDDPEIDAFKTRATKFTHMGRANDAEHLAERLTLRDRDGDDRRMCLECRELRLSGRCGAAARGAMPGVDRQIQPVPDILMRCQSFWPAVTDLQINQGSEATSHDY